LSKTQEAKAAVIQSLLDHGFEPDGETRTEIVRIPTSSSPMYGKSGGELAKFGGRLRFAKKGTDIKATVGDRTTVLYHYASKLDGVKGIAHLPTKDIENIKAALAKAAP
jgi:hypothetical protein